MKAYALLFLVIFPSMAQSQWFESSGTAIAIDNDWDSAREQAIKKAVNNALLFSGGTISSLEQVNNGVLTENSLILTSEGEIKSLTISNEKRIGNRLSLTIKVDIQPAQKVCYGSNFPKSIALTRFKLNTPEQAVNGNIFTLNKLLSKTLFNQLQLSPQTLNVRQFLDSPTKLGDSYQDNTQVDTLRSLATLTDSQFLVYGEINDISVKFDSKNSLTYWLTDPERHFYLTVYLYDALQGELISSKQYRTKAPWQYGQHENANLNSKDFWQKDYGQAILATLDEVTIDLEASLQCLPPMAKVVSVENDSIRINLGRRNGLKEEATVSLYYSTQQKDQFGIERSSKTQYQGEMQVLAVENNSAILRTVDNLPLGNIQINDLAKIK